LYSLTGVNRMFNGFGVFVCFLFILGFILILSVLLWFLFVNLPLPLFCFFLGIILIVIAGFISVDI